MTQSFHAGAATSSHARVLPNRRRTDLTPTVTAIDSGLGQPLSSREISRASTPGRRMLLSSTNGKSPGKAVSMSRLDQLARPRVLNPNKSQYTSPNEVSPSHAPISLNSNARLNHRRSRVGHTPSKNISASMSLAPFLKSMISWESKICTILFSDSIFFNSFLFCFVRKPY